MKGFARAGLIRSAIPEPVDVFARLALPEPTVLRVRIHYHLVLENEFLAPTHALVSCVVMLTILFNCHSNCTIDT